MRGACRPAVTPFAAVTAWETGGHLLNGPSQRCRSRRARLSVSGAQGVQQCLSRVGHAQASGCHGGSTRGVDRLSVAPVRDIEAIVDRLQEHQTGRLQRARSGPHAQIPQHRPLRGVDRRDMQALASA